MITLRNHGDLKELNVKTKKIELESVIIDSNAEYDNDWLGIKKNML